MRRTHAIWLCLLLLCLLGLPAFSSAQEKGRLVGAIQGTFDVSPLGQATYEVPVKVVPGTGGMAPRVSVSYSSSRRDGIVGYGFDLTGLSVISRAPQTLCHDGRATAVSLTAADRFVLDGSRLVCVSSSGGRHEFRTESDTYARITAEGDLSSPSSFTVRDKGGVTYLFFPNTAIPGAEGSGPALFWLMARATDTSGNYLTVTYGGDAACNDWWPVRIDYTGNAAAGLSPYASLRFQYEDNPLAPTAYIGGRKVRRGKALTAVTSWHGETMARRYLLTYTMLNGRRHLQSMSEQAADGSATPPTRFTWHDAPAFPVMTRDYRQESLVSKARVTVGDFNGDGISDFVSTPLDGKSGWTGWRLFLGSRDGAPKYAGCGQLTLPGDIEAALGADFNGDGYDDLVVKRKTDRGYHDTDLYLSDGRGGFVFHSCPLAVKDDYTLYPAETTGDGMTDLVACFNGSHRLRLMQSGADESGQTVPLLRSDDITFPDSHDWTAVDVADFNGDGLSDILNRHKDGYTLWHADGRGAFTGVDRGTWPTSAHYACRGDFNGDGKQDLLLTGWDGDSNKDGWTDWCMCLFRGDASHGGAAPFDKVYLPRLFKGHERTPVAIDINGDGKDDLYGVANDTAGDGLEVAQAFINDGTGTSFGKGEGAGTYGLDKWRYDTGDFNGDGRQDLLCTSTWENGSSWYGYQLFLVPEATTALLKDITDGMGHTTSVRYAPMSDAGVYDRGSVAHYPLSSFGSSWPVVAEVRTPDGLGGVRRVSYRYADAVMHHRGRGFLAFGSFTVTDHSTDIQTVRRFGVDSTVYAVAPVSTVTMLNGRLLSEERMASRLSYTHRSPDVYTYAPVWRESRAYEYNSGEMTSQSVTETAYDRHGNVVTLATTNGTRTTTTQNVYDDDEAQWRLGRLARASVAKTDGTHTVTHTSAFEYDPVSGLLCAEAFDPDNTAYGYRKTYTRDLYGNVTESVITPVDPSVAPRTTRTSYDDYGRLVLSVANALGHTTSHTVDPVLGLPLSTADANGLVTRHFYNSLGEPVRTETPLDTVVTRQEWSAGHVDAPAHALYLSYTACTGQAPVTEFFDVLGRSLRKVTVGLDGRRIYSDVRYNARGEVVAVSDPYFAGDEAVWTRTQYDDAGRQLLQTSPDGAQVSYAYDGLSTSVTDPLGRTSTTRYDRYGQLAESADAMGGAVSYTYDMDGHCVRMRGPATVVTASYDAYGHRTRLDDPDAGVSTWAYDAYGQLVAETTPHGATAYEYDALGRLVRESRPDVCYSHEYDTRWKGALSRSASTDGMEQEWQYDTYGRVTATTERILDKVFTTRQRYTAGNHLASIVYPNGYSVGYGYAPSGYLTTVTSSGGETLWHLDAANARGQAEAVTMTGGQTIGIAHDALTGRVSSVTAYNGSGRELLHNDYVFDRAGNLVARHDARHAMTERFGYDALNRLTTVWQADTVAQRMAYDAAGNIEAKSDVGYYAYQGKTNRLQYVQSRTYRPPLWNSIRYTSFNKITRLVQESDSLLLLYGVDKSRRVAVTWRGGKASTTFYVGGLYERTDMGDDTEERMFVYAGDELVAIVRGDSRSKNLFFVHKDHLGSVIAYTDFKGRLEQELSYDAWGRRRDPSTWRYYDSEDDASALQARGFTGHEHLDVFALVNMEGRMYDPVLGRFLSPDPIVQAPHFTQSLNRYAYCLNNPLALTDPSGYSWLGDNWKALVSSAVGITVAAVTGGAGAPLLLAGAAGGAASAMTGALLNGSNVGQVVKGTLTGAFWGATSSFLNNISASPNFFLSVLKHSLTEGALEGVQGGNICHGLVAGAVSGAENSLINRYGDDLGRAGKITVSAVMGGTASELGGGKFANGAITSAYGMMFNELMHTLGVKNTRKIYDAYLESFGTNGIVVNGEQLAKQVGGTVYTEIDKHILRKGEKLNACALRLSYAMNKAGVKIPNLPGLSLEGADGQYYIVNAEKMYDYLKHRYSGNIRKFAHQKNVPYGIPYINGGYFTNASGHVDIVNNYKWGSTMGKGYYGASQNKTYSVILIR